MVISLSAIGTASGQNDHLTENDEAKRRAELSAGGLAYSMEVDRPHSHARNRKMFNYYQCPSRISVSDYTSKLGLAPNKTGIKPVVC